MLSSRGPRWWSSESCTVPWSESRTSSSRSPAAVTGEARGRTPHPVAAGALAGSIYVGREQPDHFVAAVGSWRQLHGDAPVPRRGLHVAVHLAADVQRIAVGL